MSDLKFIHANKSRIFSNFGVMNIDHVGGDFLQSKLWSKVQFPLIDFFQRTTYPRPKPKEKFLQESQVSASTMETNFSIFRKTIRTPSFCLCLCQLHLIVRFPTNVSNFIFLSQWALTLPPRFDKEATFALWLTSHGAPPDCRKLSNPAGREVRQVDSSRGHNR